MACLFCKIVKNEIPAKIVFRDDLVVAFEDINPQAPHHILIIPQKHIDSLNDLTSEDNELMGHLIQTAKMLAKEFNMANDGYRLVFNCNAGAGQTVYHIHAHLLGGRRLGWPPG